MYTRGRQKEAARARQVSGAVWLGVAGQFSPEATGLVERRADAGRRVRVGPWVDRAAIRVGLGGRLRRLQFLTIFVEVERQRGAAERQRELQNPIAPGANTNRQFAH